MNSCVLNLYDSVNTFKQKSRPAGTYRQQLLLKSNSILNTIKIGVNPGTLTVNYYETLNEGLNLFDSQVYSGGMTGTFQFKKDCFHNKVLVEIITDGTTTFSLFTMCRSDPATVETFSVPAPGTTTTFVGTTTTTPELIPPVAGNIITGVSIRCAVDQNKKRRLEFSFDGTNYARLKVGEAREESPLGNITQLYIRKAGTGGSVVQYEIFLNREL